MTPDLEKVTAGPFPWWKRWQQWPRRKLYIWTSTGLILLLVVALAIGLGVHFVKQPAPSTNSIAIATTQTDTSGSIRGPAVPSNFADPSYFHDNDTNTYYAFATNKFKVNQPGQIHIQVATSANFVNWDLTSQDALPNAGKWTTNAFVWAPDVVKLDDGTYLMYYTAQVPDHLHCIGVATSSTVAGPYEPQDQPIVCPTDQGGAIDPEGFRDADGTRYLVYKIDGNSFDKPGRPFRATPLMLQRVAADGYTLEGSPVPIMDRIASDGPLVEAPSLGRYPRAGQPDLYVLFFSSNMFSGPGYDVKYATSESITGPYVRGDTPLLQTGDGPGRALIGPGGLDVGVSSTQVVFHSITKGTMGPHEHLDRPLWTAEITIQGTTVSA